MNTFIAAALTILLCTVMLDAQTRVVGVYPLTAEATDGADPNNPAALVCGVDSVIFVLDGRQIGPVLRTAPYVLNWDSTTVPNGIHAVHAQAADKAGPNNCDATTPNIGKSATVTIDVQNVFPDRIPPTVKITNPAAQSTVPSGKLDVKVASADDSRIQRIDLLVNQIVVASSAFGATTLTYNWNTNPYKGRSVTLTARAVDEFNNGPSEDSVMVNVRR